jgi:uncharacterized protein (DUF433 family)
VVFESDPPQYWRGLGERQRAGTPAFYRGNFLGMDGVGAYTGDRAAALSGVPKSTIHWWARNDVLVPSVSATRVMLWSYADLMGLRVIYWLRQRKTTKLGVEVPRTSMPAVRRALKQLRGGSPHVVHTRLETRALAALASDGFDNAAIRRLYPYVSMPQIEQALDLEQQLADNLGKRAA